MAVLAREKIRLFLRNGLCQFLVSRLKKYNEILRYDEIADER